MGKIQMITSKDGFPRRLKVARGWRGFSQIQLAKATKIPASSISHFEKGTRSPSYRSFRSLCYALGVDSEYLICRSDNVHICMRPNLMKKCQALDVEDYEIVERIIEALSKKHQSTPEEGLVK